MYECSFPKKKTIVRVCGIVVDLVNIKKDVLKKDVHLSIATAMRVRKISVVAVFV